MARRRALVLGGTGMLAGCAAALVATGWHVVLPSRRHAPIPETEVTARDTSLAVIHGARPGRALWVAADWAEPAALAAGAGRVLGGPADLLVAWVHRRVRVAVLTAVAPLLAAGAPVVEVHGGSAARPVDGCPDPVLGDHPTQQVVLGQVCQDGRSRWLTHGEISDGVLDAVRRALSGRRPAVHQVGEFGSHWAYG